MKKKKEDNFKMFQGIALITQVGLSIVTPILLGVFIGRFIDRLVGSQYIFTLILIIVGSLAGFLNILKLASKTKDKE